MISRFYILIFTVVVLAPLNLAMADSESKQTQALTKEVRALSAKVADLQKSLLLLEALKPNLTVLMPDFSERFHVMHYAGEAGDWAVAAHEFQELQRMVKIMTMLDPEKGALMEGFMKGGFDKINAAIEHGNAESFDSALNETLNGCNACHAAVGSEFVQVTLDAERSLSMRHSHKFMHNKMMGEHKHTH
jgi:hypothetical protein